MVVSRAHPYGREAVQRVVKDRMRLLLRPFIGDSFKSFLEVLNSTGGGLVGSIVRRLLAANAPFLDSINTNTSLKFDISFDLNVVVPHDRIKEMVDWLTKNGWGEWEYRMPASGYRRNVATFVTARKDIGMRKVCTFDISRQALVDALNSLFA